MKKLYYIFLMIVVAAGISTAQSKASATATISLTVIPNPSVTITTTENTLLQKSITANEKSQNYQIKSNAAFLVQRKNADGTKEVLFAETGRAQNEVKFYAVQNSVIQVVYINN